MAKDEFFKYKDKPIVKSGNTIYYGSSAEKYVIKLEILSTKKVAGEDIADRVEIQLLSTDETLPLDKRVSKQTEKNGLYNALDIGAIWLERALKKLKEKSPL